MALKDNLKTIRKNRGITQRKLAEDSKLSFSMVSKLESGEQSNPSYETLQKIAEALDVTTSELLGSSISVSEALGKIKINKLIWDYLSPEEKEEHEKLIELTKEPTPVEGSEKIVYEKYIQAILNNLKYLNIAGHHTALKYIVDLSKNPDYRRL